MSPAPGSPPGSPPSPTSPGSPPLTPSSTSPASSVSIAAARAALKEVEGTAAKLAMFSTDYEGGVALPSVGERRRRLRSGDPDPVASVSLVLNDDGVLLWRDSAQSAELTGRQLRRGMTPVADGDLVELYQFEKLTPNQVNDFLIKLDGELNPALNAPVDPGVGADGGLNALALLRRLELTPGTADLTLLPLAAPPQGKKRRLLLVHGTFSKSEAFAEGFARAGNGADFLKRVFDHYEEVLAFDHPTLSVSPVLNAFDLCGLMAKATGPLDVVAHSRGGLVARWFLEGFGAALGEGPYRAVLVGVPLGGTSLAAPGRLRAALGLLSNFGTTLKMTGAVASAYVPLLVAPLALLKVASSAVGVAAKTPLIDAAVSMVPGLAGQSRVQRSQEIGRLRGLAFAKPPSYFVVQSNFETEAVGWKFWRWFRSEKLKDLGADQIFPGPNDLVVDTGSMTELALAPTLAKAHCHDFETSSTVHHTNYFEQEKTLSFILRKLNVP